MDDADQMAVEFVSTVEDAVDVHRRFIRRSRVCCGWRWVVGLVVCGFAYMLWADYAGAAVLVVAAAAWAVIAVGTLVLCRREDERHLRVFYADLLAGNDVISVRVRVGPDGVGSEAPGHDALVRWERVAGIEVVDGRVDIWVRPDGLITVRDRAFRSDAERDRFVGLVGRYVKEQHG